MNETPMNEKLDRGLQTAAPLLPQDDRHCQHLPVQGHHQSLVAAAWSFPASSAPAAASHFGSQSAEHAWLKCTEPVLIVPRTFQ